MGTPFIIARALCSCFGDHIFITAISYWPSTKDSKWATWNAPTKVIDDSVLTDEVFSWDSCPWSFLANSFSSFISVCRASSSFSAFFKVIAFLFPEVSILKFNLEINWDKGAAITALIEILSILLKFELSVLS